MVLVKVTAPFIGDWRRVNVTVTRARRLLWVLGSKKILDTTIWGKWIQYATVTPAPANPMRDYELNQRQLRSKLAAHAIAVHI